MSRFDHRVFIYMSLETTQRQRLTLSRHLELPHFTDLLERVTVTCQLLEIGLRALAWALAGNLAENLAGNLAEFSGGLS
jgi:hypothetical protein